MAASVARHNPTEAVRVSDPMAIAGRIPTVVLNSDRTAVNIMTRFTKIVLIQAWGAASMPVTGIGGSSRSWVPGGLIYGQPSTANTELVRAAAHRYCLCLNATNHVACVGWHRRGLGVAARRAHPRFRMERDGAAATPPSGRGAGHGRSDRTDTGGVPAVMPDSADAGAVIANGRELS
jgi:hypothetical protein